MLTEGGERRWAATSAAMACTTDENNNKGLHYKAS
jgi:hypothetical protein